MPKCAHCDRQWRYMETLQHLFSLKCPVCGNKNYLTAKSRNWNGMSSLLYLPVIILIFMFSELSVVGMVFLGIGLFIVSMMVQPLMLELSKEEEPFG